MYQPYPQSPEPAHPSAPAGHGPSSVVHWMVPIGRSWQAVAAGYVALFAIFVWPLGPIALGLGGWALARASKDGSHGRGRAGFAVIVGLLSTVLLVAILATL